MPKFLFSCVIRATIFVLVVATAPIIVLGSVCCAHRSKLAYYADDGAVKVGACGYGSFAGTLSGGNVAAIGPSFYKSGSGCSTCYQIRCSDPKLCRKSGTNIVVTDLTTNDQTDFVVLKQTFSSLALAHMGSKLVKSGIVDIEYRRIFCEYPGHNLTVKVDESSQYPYYLALQFLYQGGQTEIMGVDVATVGNYNWRYLTRNHGAIWDISIPPAGPLHFRYVVTSGYDGYRLWSKGPVLPSRWQSGSLYDCGLQINQTDLGACEPCDNSDWTDSAA